MVHPFITDAQATQKIQESYNDIVNSIGTGFQGAITIADTPTEDGVYLPTEEGTYPKAGGLVYNPEEGITYFIRTDGVWTKNVTPINFTPTGVVEEGNTQAVSGGEVYSRLNPFIELPNNITFNLLPGELNTNGEPNSSLNWLRTAPIPCMENQDYYVEGLGVSLSGSTKRVFFYNGNVFLNYIDQYPLTSSFNFTTPIGCNNFMIQVGSAINIGADIPNSPFWETLKISNEPIEEGYTVAEKIKGTIETDQIKDLEESSALFQSLLVESFSEVSIATTSGSLTTSGIATNDINYRRTSVTNVNSMADVSNGNTYTYTGQIQDSGYAGVVFKSESLETLGVACTEIKSYNREELELPEGTKYIATCSYLTEPIIEEKIISIKTETSINNLIYVNANYIGDESNGTLSKPFKTITEAIDYVKDLDSANIVISGGDYRETIDLTNSNNSSLTISAKQNEKVRVIGSTKVDGWSKTDSYTNIYEAKWDYDIIKPTRGEKRVFVDFRDSKEIPDEERNALQNGLLHRLPFSELAEIPIDVDLETSLGLLDSSAGSFVLDMDNGDLYIHTNDSDNPSTNGFSYEIPSRLGLKPPTSNKGMDLRLDFIESYYSNGFGFDFLGLAKVIRNNVKVFGSRHNGFSDESQILVAYRDEAGGAGNDGSGGHFTRFANFQDFDYRAGTGSHLYIEPWYHDNRDDGISHHEFSDGTCIGGLFEYNRKAGVIPANGGNWRQYGGLARNNGNGFYVGNPMTGKPYSVAYVQNFTSEKNGYNFRLSSDSAWVLELDNCVSREATTVGYSSNLGKMIALNCKSTQTNGRPHKEELGGGSIEVINDDDLS